MKLKLNVWMRTIVRAFTLKMHSHSHSEGLLSFIMESKLWRRIDNPSFFLFCFFFFLSPLSDWWRIWRGWRVWLLGKRGCTRVYFRTCVSKGCAQECKWADEILASCGNAAKCGSVSVIVGSSWTGLYFRPPRNNNRFHCVWLYLQLLITDCVA